MRRILLVLFALGICSSPALTDPANLAGGVMIVHNPPPMAYCSGMDFCAFYFDEGGISDASEQVVRIDGESTFSEPVFWYVVAAFTEDKVWCGTQFGLGDYDPYGFYMTGAGNCQENSLEIPTAGWPGPNTGISIAATDVLYEGNYQPLYWFLGYSYYGPSQPTLIEITVDPSQDFIGFGNCEAPAEVWPAIGGAMGVFTDGVAVYPSAPAACCFPDGHCEMLLEEDCIDGVFYPDDICDTDPCPQPPLGACCYSDGSCAMTTEADCAGVGDWLSDQDCASDPCPGSPVGSPSWGEIKTLYR